MRYCVLIALWLLHPGAISCRGVAAGDDLDGNSSVSYDACACDVVPRDVFIAGDVLVDSSVDSDANVGDDSCPLFVHYIGHLLVSTGTDIVEMTLGGAEITRFTVPSGGSVNLAETTIRDLKVGPCGRVVCYYGTFEPSIAERDLHGQWQYIDSHDFSTVNNVTYGGIALSDNHIFVTDMSTSTSPHSGVVQFDFTGSGILFSNSDPIDLNYGLDGLLYVLDGETTVIGYEPETMVSQFSINLSHPVRSIAADSSGNVFGAAWSGMLYKFSPSGVVVDSVDSMIDELSDIDVDRDGTIAVGSFMCDIVITDVAFSNIFSFSIVGGGCKTSFVAFTSGSQ